MAERNVSDAFSMYERIRGSADGKTMLPVVEALNQRIDDFLKDMFSVEANMGLRHRIRRQNSIPTPSFRAFYQGVSKNTATTQMVVEPLALIEDRNEIDEDELDTLTNPKEERRSQDMAFLEGMGRKIVDVFVNGGEDATTGQAIDGWADRLSTLQINSTDRKNVMTAGGSSNLTSIYIAEWGPKACMAIYPPGYVKGSKYGIIVRNKGKEKVYDGSSNAYYAYVTQFKSWLGCGVADELKLARIPNYDYTGSFKTVEDLIIKILNKCHFTRGRTRIYCNEDVRAQIEIRSKDKANLNWSPGEVFGREVMRFSGGAVLRTIDSAILTSSESAVT